MPIYEYQCVACGHQFEKFRKPGAEALRECPKCGKLELEKLISSPSFKLEGTGWYETDFKGKNKQGGNEATSAAKSDKAAETNTKGDAS